MRITNAEELDGFKRDYPEAAMHLDRFAKRVLELTWRNPHDAENTVAGCEHLGNRRLKFRIRGNRFRLIALVNYRMGTLEIRFFGTHREYDEIRNHLEV